jgi:hypothetical protein
MGTNSRPVGDVHAADPASEEEPIDQVKELLGEHVPLSLIMDLSSPDGPHSEQILADEGTPDEQWWTEG